MVGKSMRKVHENSAFAPLGTIALQSLEANGKKELFVLSRLDAVFFYCRSPRVFRVAKCIKRCGRKISIAKLGKNILSILLLSTGLLQAIEIKVTLPDLEKKSEASGQEVAIATVGEVFGIVIEINSSGEIFDEVSLSGLGAFDVVGKSEGDSTSQINGKISRTRTISLQVKNSKPGLYKLGPVEVRAETQVISGNELYCRVEKNNNAVVAAAALEGEIILPKNEVYCGEPFDVTIRYMLYDQVLQIQPDFPEQAHFLVKGVRESGVREILRNGKLTRVYEYVITYLPVKTGTVAIGPMPVHYTVRSRKQPSKRAIDPFFESFFGPQIQVEQKESSAPAVHMRVKELPKNSKKTALVGQIKEFIIAVDKPTALVNDPIKLSVMFSGKGNLDFIEELPLELPAGFKIYKAKTSLDKLPGDSGMVAKTIEYVLQVNKSGPVEIPAQQLLYFDPEAAVYKTIMSNSVELFLTGDAVEQPKKSIDELAREVNEDASQKKINKEPAYIFDDAGHCLGSLPWWLFIMLLLLPMLLYVRTVLALVDEKILKRFKKQPKAHEIIALASKELADIMHAGKAERLNQFFAKTMAVLWQLHEQDVTEQIIEQHLSKLGWDEERLREFVDYLHACASLQFTKQAAGEEVKVMLLKKAQYWLLLLGKA